MNARAHHLQPAEIKILKSLNTPQKIQDFLDRLPINFEKRGETLMSPRRALRERKAHCFEGALIAALALWFHGERPLLLDLKTTRDDVDHVVTLFRQHGRFGALSKTNHAVLRYREPIYRTVRELALSYFHEYFLDSGKKTLRSFSKPFDLSRYKDDWVTTEKDLWDLSITLDRSPHDPFFPKAALRVLRPADPIEIQAGKLVQWKR